MKQLMLIIAQKLFSRGGDTSFAWILLDLFIFLSFERTFCADKFSTLSLSFKKFHLVSSKKYSYARKELHFSDLQKSYIYFFFFFFSEVVRYNYLGTFPSISCFQCNRLIQVLQGPLFWDLKSFSRSISALLVLWGAVFGFLGPK